MSTLAIKTYPDAILRTRCKPLKNVTESEKSILSNMAETMYKTYGIGLAAPQIGIAKNIIIVDIGRGLLKMFNPKIISKKGSSTLEEGCLSIPKKLVTIQRADEITVSYTDEHNNEKTKIFHGLTARVIQHEIDHINGRLIIDYLPWYKKLFSQLSQK